MEKIVFNKERKGYDPSQVEKYVEMLQEKYIELGKTYEELHRGIRDAKEEFDEDSVNSLKRREEELRSEYALEESNLISLKEELEAEVKSQKDLQRKWDVIQQESMDLKTEADIENLKKEIEKLTLSLGEREKETGLDRLQRIFEEAKDEAKQRILAQEEETKEQVEAIQKESERILQEGKAQADEIRKEQVRAQEQRVEERKIKNQKQAEDFEQEQQKLQEVCEDIRRKAEEESREAKQEAELIERLTMEVYASAKEKETVVLEEIDELIENSKQAAKEEFETLKCHMEQAGNELLQVMTRVKNEMGESSDE